MLVRKKDITKLVKTGKATDISNLNFKEGMKLYNSHELQEVAYSLGIYGYNARLFKDKSNKLYAITKRTSIIHLYEY